MESVKEINETLWVRVQEDVRFWEFEMMTSRARETYYMVTLYDDDDRLGVGFFVDRYEAEEAIEEDSLDRASLSVPWREFSVAARAVLRGNAGNMGSYGVLWMEDDGTVAYRATCGERYNLDRQTLVELLA